MWEGAADEMFPKARRRNEEERVARPRLLVADVLRHADRVGEAGSSGLVRGAQATCAICQEDFDDQSPDGFTKCGHRFHTACLGGWLKHNRSKCPICRVSLRVSDES